MVANFFQDDLDKIFFDTTAFGSTITYTPQPSGTAVVFPGIFDNAQEVYDSQSQSYLSSMPQIQCSTIHVSGISINDLVNVSNTNFRVAKSLDNGNGVTTVYLTKGQVSK